MDPLGLFKLPALMERTSGSPELKIGLIDGPVVMQHPPGGIGKKKRVGRDRMRQIPHWLSIL